jgi:hypothetical protein
MYSWITIPKFHGGYMKPRLEYLIQIQKHFRIQPICAILGPRQVGKTTLAHQFAQQIDKKVEFFDLENPTHLASLQNPMLTLGK